VCTNLILNAVQAMPEGGKLTLRTTADEKEIKVEVADNGQGMSREHIRKLFTPFFTTKGRGKGVGLGLAVAQGLVQHHQGRIEVKSEEGRGSAFTVVLPLRLEEHEESAQNPCG